MYRIDLDCRFFLTTHRETPNMAQEQLRTSYIGISATKMHTDPRHTVATIVSIDEGGCSQPGSNPMDMLHEREAFRGDIPAAKALSFLLPIVTHDNI